MRKAVIAVWLTLPVLVGAYHYGPGQDRWRMDDVRATIASARQAAQQEDWFDAYDQFDAALKIIPEQQLDLLRQIRLERAKAAMFVKRLPEAHQDLKDLVTELEGQPEAPPTLLADSCAALANAQYYMTWLMRLEGQPREVWEPEIESSRQLYRMLAEQTLERGGTAQAAGYQEDLESAIRLARMDLSELQGLPLPSQ